MKTTYLCFCIIFWASLSQAEQFQAPITDTRWQVTESPLECTLSQSISGFGEGQFSQESGGGLNLVFTTTAYPATQNNVHFEIAEAPWQNSSERLHLTSLPTTLDQKKFILSGNLAKQAFTQIQEGRFPAVRYTSQNSQEEITVLLSAIHLSDSLPAFEQCISGLHPDVYDDIRKLTIHFNIEQAELSIAAKKALERLADYVKIDPDIKQITITGYTDNHGRQRLNAPLSEARAIAVKNFLVQECQLPEQLITTSSRLERNPSATNKTPEGRALNRRAEIELLK